ACFRIEDVGHAPELVDRHVGLQFFNWVTVLIEGLYSPLHMMHDKLATDTGLDLAAVDVVDFPNFHLSDISVLVYRNGDIRNNSPPVRLPRLHGNCLAANYDVGFTIAPYQTILVLD